MIGCRGRAYVSDHDFASDKHTSEVSSIAMQKVLLELGTSIEGPFSRLRAKGFQWMSPTLTVLSAFL